MVFSISLCSRLKSTDLKLGIDSLIYLYFFNDVIGISDNIASNGRIIRSNIQRNGNDVGKKRSWPKLNYPASVLWGLREVTTLSQNSQLAGRVSNPVLPKCEGGVLITLPLYPVQQRPYVHVCSNPSLIWRPINRRYRV
jgi:hypothetical protein